MVTNTPWKGMVSIDDTALAVTDSGGVGRPVVYLNGSYASQRSWRPVIRALGADWRHITYDERARGRSKRSADYSFEGCLRDLDTVLTAREIERPLLVGWSYGAALAMHWADRHPERVAGVVAVDGGVPWGYTGEDGRAEIRKVWRKLGWMLPFGRPFGLTASMSASQHAEVNIEINEICARLAPVLERLSCPVRYILASGANLGGGAKEMEEMRSSLDPVLAKNPNLQVSAKVDSNHTQILRKDFQAIAEAVREVAAVAAE